MVIGGGLSPFSVQVFWILPSPVKDTMEISLFLVDLKAAIVCFFRQLQQQQADLEGGGTRDALYEAGPIIPQVSGCFWKGICSFQLFTFYIFLY